jgi:hypothetical protein
MAQRDYYDKLAFPFERNLQRPFYDVTTPEEVTGRFDSTSDPSTTAPAANDAGPLPELDPSEFPADPGLKRGTSGAYEGQGKGVAPAFRGFYPQDTSFEDKIDPKYQAHSTSGVGYFDVAPNQQDPNAYDRDPRDYKSPQDPQGQEAQKRYWLRSYLEQKMKKAGDFGQLDQAKIDQNRVTDIADYGHGLDRMFTARSAALGGQGVNENFWRGMKQDAAGRTALADDARKNKIQEYMMSQRLGSEGVAEMDRIRKSQFEAAMQDPTSPVSRSAQFAFSKNFPDRYSQMVDENGQNMVQHMTGADIQQMIKNLEADSKMRIAEGVSQANIDRMTSEMDARTRELDLKGDNQKLLQAQIDMKREMLPYEQDESISRVEKNYATKAGPGGKKYPVTDLEVDGKPVMRDEQGNIYDLSGNPVDGSKVQSRREIDDIEARDVNGIGKARTKQEAIDLRKNIETTSNIMSGIDEIEKIMAKGPVYPMTPEAAAIRSRTDFIMGQLRLPMQGPGAMTDSDREQLRGAIGDAAAVLSIKSNTRAKLGAVKSTLQSNLENAKKASIIGYKGKETEGEDRIYAPLAPPKDGYTWMEDPNDGTRAQVPNESIEKYKAAGGRVLK